MSSERRFERDARKNGHLNVLEVHGSVLKYVSCFPLLHDLLLKKHNSNQYKMHFLKWCQLQEMFFQVCDIYNHETLQEHYGILSLKVTFGVHMHIKKIPQWEDYSNCCRLILSVLPHICSLSCTLRNSNIACPLKCEHLHSCSSVLARCASV